MTYARSPRATAHLLLINVKDLLDEASKDISRFRITRLTVRRISRRQVLSATFLADLKDELAALGWVFFELPLDFGLLEMRRTATWGRLTSKRVLDSGLATATEEAIATAFIERFGSEFSVYDKVDTDQAAE